ncbi:hypothetical protein [Mesorhizobium caraganae]|uniref:hypothetical protein n=1 Tax=Mesorhizobium caraganae TaxID=483206 RepID=UPI003337E071
MSACQSFQLTVRVPVYHPFYIVDQSEDRAIRTAKGLASGHVGGIALTAKQTLPLATALHRW